MNVTLTWRELNVVAGVATPRHRHFIEQTRASLRPNRHEARMPAAAWRALLPLLQERAWNRKGEWSSKAVGAREALVKVSRALLALEGHPAIHGTVAIDSTMVHPVVAFPAPGDTPWSPYPDHSDELVVLWPSRTTDVEIDLGNRTARVPGVYWTPLSPALAPGGPEFKDVADHLGWG